jgi:hypothetical protein
MRKKSGNAGIATALYHFQDTGIRRIVGHAGLESTFFLKIATCIPKSPEFD